MGQGDRQTGNERITPGGAASPKLLDPLSEQLRVCHYSLRTEEAYADWVRRFILFHGKRHPREMGKDEIEAFLTHLAVERRVSPSTQNQAKAALLFLYRQVLEVELPWLGEVIHAKRKPRLPVVLSMGEVRILFGQMEGTMGLVAGLLYGTGMRLMEGLRLRVKDMDFDRMKIIVRDGKGGKDRITPLPASLVTPLRAHLGKVRVLHQQDLEDGFGEVALFRRTCCGIPSPRTSSRGATISAPSRNYWGTRTWRPR